MENDAFRMQNGGRKVAISGAPIDAQGCGLSPVPSTKLFPAGVTPRKPSSGILFYRWLVLGRIGSHGDTGARRGGAERPVTCGGTRRMRERP